MITKTEWAWLAGFIDGDGCFTCGVSEQKYVDRAPSVLISPRVCASQKNRKILDYIVSLTGVGRVYSKKSINHSVTPQDSLNHMWIVYTYGEAYKICEGVLPYIIEKKPQCIIMMELLKLKLENVHTTLSKFHRIKTPIDVVLKLAELGLSLNPESSAGRNSRHNTEIRTFQYWKKRIPEIYAEKDLREYNYHKDKKVSLICNNCRKQFFRLTSLVKENVKLYFCNRKCYSEYKANTKRKL